MMTSIALIGGVVVLEAPAVYSYLSARAFGTPTAPWAMARGLGIAAVICVLATIVPIRVALQRLDAVER